MKPAPFDYEMPGSVAEAVTILGQSPGAKVLAGGQSLGPMLNLRLVRPTLIVDVTRIGELTAVEHTGDGVTVGACITHANIEDGRITDPSDGFLARVAHGIAYRAVRNRGTIGGSLAHGDPSADWIATLIALDGVAIVTGPSGRRRVAVSDIVQGAMDVRIEQDELITQIYIPQLSEGAHTGYHKICRKTGEFADAICVVVEDGAKEHVRVVFGATEGAPIVAVDARDLIASDGSGIDHAATRRFLTERGSSLAGDHYKLNILTAAFERAFRDAHGKGGGR